VTRLREAIGVLALAVGCGKSPPPGTAVTSPSAAAAGGPEAAVAVEPMDEREEAQWAAARGGEPEELMRLADLVGCEGLRARAARREELVGTAARAMEFCPDFSELPWLALVGASGADADARAALEAIVQLAARPRRATDPEDAEELHEGCASLLALARATDRQKERRVLAIRALRMLAERGCVARSEIPTDLDAR
jgi:hypothetical protein